MPVEFNPLEIAYLQSILNPEKGRWMCELEVLQTSEDKDQNFQKLWKDYYTKQKELVSGIIDKLNRCEQTP